MATLTSKETLSLDAFLEERRIKPDLIATLKEELDLDVPDDFADLEDEDIDSFIEDHKLKGATKNKLVKAYRAIKYGEDERSSFSSRRSSLSSMQSRSGSRNSTFDTTSDDGSFIVGNYRIRKDKPCLRTCMEAHCDIFLAETDDEDKTPLVAKISTDAVSAAALEQECTILRHVRARLGMSSSDFVVKLIKMVER